MRFKILCLATVLLIFLSLFSSITSAHNSIFFSTNMNSPSNYVNTVNQILENILENKDIEVLRMKVVSIKVEGVPRIAVKRVKANLTSVKLFYKKPSFSDIRAQLKSLT